MIRRALLVLLLAAPLCAQTFSPKTIVFTGADADPRALTAIVAIPLTRPTTQKEIEDALARLDATGLFADIRYTVDSKALTFTLTPQPPTVMVPVVYGNFLLWKPEELTPLVHARVPLFTGKVPTSGTLQQSVADALTTILLDRGIKGRVEFTVSSDKTLIYTIAEPQVLIRQVHLEGVSPAAAAKVNAALQSFAASEYDRRSPAAIRQRLLETYLDLGFLDAAIDLPTSTAPVIEPTRIQVDFTSSAHENGQYHIAKLEWPVTPIVSQADFDRAVTLHTGDPASRIELLSAPVHAEFEFKRHGYLDAKITSTNEKNASAHTMAYTFTVQPGEQYHLRSVHAVGFTEEQQKDFDRLWKLAPGAVYDLNYIQSFFQRNAAVASFRGFQASTKSGINQADHSVDLLVMLNKPGAKPQ